MLMFLSSDLWVNFFDGTPSSAKNTGKQVTLSYAVGKAAGSFVWDLFGIWNMKPQLLGDVQTVEVQLGNATVENQAFCVYSYVKPRIFLTHAPVNVANTSSFTSNIHQQGYDGLLGLGPNSGSVIWKTLDDNAGNTFLSNFFSQSKASAYFLSFFLNRINDPGETMTGQFTVNEVLSSLSNITSMPKLDVDKVNRLLKAGEYWSWFWLELRC